MKHAPKVTEQELADARYALAMEILEAPNASEILSAIHELVMTQMARAIHNTSKDKKKKAREWKRAADELYTVLMCAVYTHQDQDTE